MRSCVRAFVRPFVHACERFFVRVFVRTFVRGCSPVSIWELVINKGYTLSDAHAVLSCLLTSTFTAFETITAPETMHSQTLKNSCEKTHPQNSKNLTAQQADGSSSPAAVQDREAPGLCRKYGDVDIPVSLFGQDFSGADGRQALSEKLRALNIRMDNGKRVPLPSQTFRLQQRNPLLGEVYETESQHLVRKYS